MTTPTTTPWPHDTVGARSFAQIVIETYDDVAADLNEMLAQHRIFGPMIAAIPAELRAEQERESRGRLAKLFAGDWDAYIAPLQAQGEQYAAAGLRFEDWYELTSAWSRAMVPRVATRLASDPALLSATLEAQLGLIDRVMAILGHAYIAASQAQIRLRQSELERWEAIFRHAAWGVLVAGADGAIELANPAFSVLCGHPFDTLVGSPFANLFAEGERDRVRASISDVAQRDGRASYETLFRRSDGSTVPVRVDAARIPSGSSSPRWALNVIDITERKRADSLERRSAELEAENRRIQEASRLKSEFLANMSHELRTPLNSIIGFAELLHLGQVGAMPPKQHEFVGDILTSGRHLLRLINDVLDLSKVESGTMQFRPEATDLRAVAMEVYGVLRGTATERSIAIEIAIDESVRHVTLDPGRLKQVLYNYLSNALKFSPPGGVVRLGARPDGSSSVRVEVSDEGPGIPVEEQHRLFVEFEQLDGGRAKTHAGTGLGLALTRRLVEAQGGTVGVDSARGAGATFHAVLPRRAPRTSLPQPRRIAGPSARAPRILVVEDDARDQDRIVSALVSAGYAVDTAATGAQARRACEERAYDAVTLDLMLADMSGLEVLAAIRSTSRNGAVPVIVISVVSETVTTGFVVHDALPKPLQSDSLLASLARAGVTPPGSGPVLVVDDDDASAKLMVETLAQLGFEAMVARDGAEALTCCARTRPSAVVLDLVMPTLDGFGFLDQFRARPEWAKIPVLVWTMKDLGPTEHGALMQRAQAVLHKDGGGARSLADTMREHLVAERPEPVRSPFHGGDLR